MKNIKTITAVIFLALTLSMVSCKDKVQEGNKNEGVIAEEIAEQGNEYTSTYVCPMHCEDSGSEEEGSCPKCGMTYVVNTEHTADGHKH